MPVLVVDAVAVGVRDEEDVGVSVVEQRTRRSPERHIAGGGRQIDARLKAFEKPLSPLR